MRWTSAQVEVIELSTGSLPTETFVEARIARLESDVAHVRSDVVIIGADVRALSDKMDGLGARLDAKIDGVANRLDTKIENLGTRFDVKIDGFDANIDGLANRLDAKIDGVKDSIAAMQRWAIVLYIALSASTFGTMARAFGWL